MPRFFFDLADREVLRDDVGLVLDDLAEARAQAVLILAGAVMPKAAAALLGARWRVAVRDEAGAQLFSLEYRAATAPDGGNRRSHL